MRSVDDEGHLNTLNRRVGEWLSAIGSGRGVEGLVDGLIVDVRFKLPTEEDPMVLMVVRATSAAGRHVAFVGAGTVEGALLAWRKKDAGRGLKWRADRPWGEV